MSVHDPTPRILVRDVERQYRVLARAIDAAVPVLSGEELDELAAGIERLADSVRTVSAHKRADHSPRMVACIRCGRYLTDPERHQCGDDPA